jgi:hypothetical protein
MDCPDQEMGVLLPAMLPFKMGLEQTVISPFSWGFAFTPTLKLGLCRHWPSRWSLWPPHGCAGATGAMVIGLLAIAAVLRADPPALATRSG